MADNPQESEPASLQGFVTVLATGGVAAGAYLAFFLIFRMSQRRFYAPRSYLGSLRDYERTPALPSGLFNWIGKFIKTPDAQSLNHQALDAFLFLRFLKICTAICFFGLVITWPILFPINATGGGDSEQLDILSMSNIDTGKSSGRNRFFAHVFVAVIYYGFVMFMILRESIFYINLRQAYLLAPQNSERVSSRTVLFTSVPKKYLNEAKLRDVFGPSAKIFWIARKTDEIDDVVEKRDKNALLLEKAEVQLIVAANKARTKALGKSGEGSQDLNLADKESGSIADRWVPQKKRPTHRTGPLGLIGKKVDTIDWCRTELQRQIPEAQNLQNKYRQGEYDAVGSVFVEFHTQADAQASYQILTHHQALQMSPRFAGVRPDDVIWKNLFMPSWQKVVRRYIVIGAIIALIIFWAVPVAVVGTFSQITFLRERFDWLSFLDKVPKVVMGFITGLLPVVALSVLMSLVPVVIRLLATLSGEVTYSRVELFTQNAYFTFQFIQVFLITTVSGSASSLAGELANNPMSVFPLISSALPRSSNFYICYFIVQGITIASTVLAQAAGLVIFRLMYKFLSKTPRAMYQKWTTLSALSFGELLPVYTNIVVISITFSVIAPLVLFWSTFGIGLFYVAYRYNILFVTRTPVDTQGLIYPRALKHLFTGIYLAEICLIGMCSVARAYGPLGIAIALLVVTILFNITLSSILSPLLYNLPLTLLTDANEDKEADAEEAANPTQRNKAGKTGNMCSRFLQPWKHADYHYFRKFVAPHMFPTPVYDVRTERGMYLPPTVASEAPLLWIPRDAAGISQQEISRTNPIIRITDEGSNLDEKNKIVWEEETARPPIYEEKPPY